MAALTADLGLGHMRLRDEFPSIEGSGAEYGPPNGSAELRQAVAGLEKVPVEYVAITTGASLGLVSTLASVGPPYSILCPVPYYPAYPRVARILGLDLIPYPLHPDRGWLPQPGMLERLVRNDTRVLLWNFPHNPTGSVACRQALEEIARFAMEIGLVVVSDEVYGDFIYEGVWVNPMEVIDERSVVRLRSFSKGFGMPGERLGYVVTHPERARLITGAHWALAMSPPSTAQQIALNLVNQSEGLLSRLRGVLMQRRLLALEILRQGERIRVHQPAGGIFCWLEIGDCEIDSMTLSTICREQFGVVVVPGAVFGVDSPTYLRASFAVPEDELLDGFNCLLEVLERLPHANLSLTT